MYEIIDIFVAHNPFTECRIINISSIYDTIKNKNKNGSTIKIFFFTKKDSIHRKILRNVGLSSVMTAF